MSVDAFELVRTVGADGLPKKAASVAFAGENVYVGTGAGSITIFKLQRPEAEDGAEGDGGRAGDGGGDGEEDGDMAIYHVNKGLGGNAKKPVAVQQMEVMEELGMLVVLWNGTVTLRGLDMLQRYPDRMPEVSDALCVCVDSPPSRRICVAQKRALLLFQWNAREQRFSQFKRIAVDEPPVGMAWHGNIVCAAYKRQYALVDVEYGQPREVPAPLDGDTRPIVQLIRSSAAGAAARADNAYELLVVASPNLGLFISFDGEMVPKNPLPFSARPLCVGTCGDYLVAMLDGGGVDVFSLLDQTRVQGLRFDGGEVAGSGPPGARRLLLASPTEVVTLRLSSTERQVRQYLDQAMVEQAWQLLLRTAPPAAARRAFHAQAAAVLLERLHFRPAVRRMELAGLDPRELLSCFPELDVPDHAYEPPDGRRRLPEGPAAALVKAGYRRACRGGPSSDDQLLRDRTEPELLRYALAACADYLWRARSGAASDPDGQPGLAAEALRDPEARMRVDTALLVLAVTLQLDAAAAASKKGKKSSSSASAAAAAAEAASAAEPDPNDPLVRVLGTGRVPYTLRDLLTRENACLIQFSERFLLSKQQYSALALLNASRGLHRKALEIWMRLGTGEFQNRSSPEAVAAALGETPGPAPGVMPTVELLSGMDDSELLWEFAPWVLQQYPEDGLEIFVSPTRRQRLNPDTVLAFLRAQQARMPDDEPMDFVEEYLEYLMYDQVTSVPAYHNQLACLFIDRVLALHPDPRAPAPGDRDPTEGPAIPEVDGPRPRPGTEPGELGRYRRKLMRFLDDSVHYDVREILARVADTQLHDEIIALYARLGEHEEVLKTYVYRLGDHEGAAEYCLSVPDRVRRLEEGRAAASEAAAGAAHQAAAVGPRARQQDLEALRSECFVFLVRIYFTTPSEARARSGAGVRGDPAGSPLEGGVRRALDLLNRYSVHINPVQALREVPPEVPARSLARYLQRVVPHSLHRRREAQVVRNLSRVENVAARAELGRLKSRWVTVSEHTRCAVCRLRITSESFFTVPPGEGSQPVHYTCFQQPQRRDSTASGSSRRRSGAGRGGGGVGGRGGGGGGAGGGAAGGGDAGSLTLPSFLH